MLTKKELAKKLSVSLPMIDKWRSQGMPFLKIGKSVRFKWEDVEKWLDANFGRNLC